MLTWVAVLHYQSQATVDVLANKMVVTWLTGHALGGILSVREIPERLCRFTNVTRAYNDIGVSS